MTRRDIEFNAEGVILRGWFYPAEASPGRDGGDGARLLSGEGDVPGRFRRGVLGGRAERAGVRQPQLRGQRRRAPAGNRPVGAGPRLPARDHLRRHPRRGRRRPDRDLGHQLLRGHVLVVGAIDRRVKAVVCQVPLISGRDNLQALVRSDFLAGFREMFDADRLPGSRASGPADGAGGRRGPAGRPPRCRPRIPGSGSPRPERPARRPGATRSRCARPRCSASTSRCLPTLDQPDPAADAGGRGRSPHTGRVRDLRLRPGANEPRSW